MAKIIDKYPCHFYKTDIDCNRYTDLVVDAGIVIVVMDMGGKFEGHMFSNDPDIDSYGFRDFISLQDGTIALLLRHDHNPCTLKHWFTGGNVTYITDTIIDKVAIPRTLKIDTLYKLTTGLESKWVHDADSLKIVEYKYTDTMDMKLYNMIDTIVYKFHGFAKYNNHFTPRNISKIDYSYTASYGTTSDIYTCLEINKNGQCFLQYSGGRPNYSGVLDSERISDVWNMISYLDIKSKEDNYTCDIDHTSGSTFAIYFDDGTAKKIQTWGYCPVLDLGYLSKNISSACKAINWQPSEIDTNLKCPCDFPFVSGNHNNCFCRW